MRSLTLVLAIVSAPLNASEIDDLVNTSQSIRDTFAYGIKTIAGGEAYALDGQIAPSMAKNGGHISEEQQNAYNAAVAAVAAATYSYDPGAEQYFQDQTDQAMDVVSEMIDVPHDCLVFTRQQIERHFYDRHEWLVECFA